MSNAIFPAGSFPGLAWPRVRTPVFKTDVQTSDNGRAWRAGRALYPTYKIRLAFNYISHADYKTLSAFFKARHGRGDTFLFDDRDDRAITSFQTLGTGDGTTAGFQLLRSLDGFIEPVGPLNTSAVTPTVRVNGTPTVDYTVDDYGWLTLTTPAPAGHVVDWKGEYYWRVAFARDEHEYTEFMREFWELRTCELETVKP